VKTTSYRALASLVLAVGILPGLFAQIPDWYTTHKNVRYPSEMYIIGVGAGSGSNATETAKKAAQMDVVSQIRVQVQAEAKNVSESFQFNNNEQLFSDFRSNVRTAVSDEITGMEVAETVTDNATGTAYALVVLDRDKYCETIRTEMDAGWKQANDLRTAAFGFAKQGKLNDALQNFLETRNVITPLLPKQALYNAVSTSPYNLSFDFGPTTLSSDIRKVLSDVKLQKRSGDKQKGKIGESFSEPFVIQVTINQEGKSVPVIGSPVVFETQDKMTLGDATSDDQGQASLSTTVRAMTGNGIRARLAFKKLDREFEQDLLSSAVNFSWTAEASSIAFAVKIDTKSSKTATALKEAFSSAITQIGYKVMRSSKYVIEVIVETGESSKVEGMAGTMYSVSANVISTLVDQEAGNTIGSVTFSGKGLARSESEAAEKAVGNVKIVLTDLSDLLQKALEK
jgi:hypothetical protein